MLSFEYKGIKCMWNEVIGCRQSILTYVSNKAKEHVGETKRVQRCWVDHKSVSLEIK